MKPKNVLAMVSPMSAERVNGIARYAREHGWNLMIQDRLGHTPLAWNGDGILATLRSDPVTFRCIEKLMKRGIPLVDLTVSCPEIKVPRVTSDHSEIGRLAARHFAERIQERLRTDFEEMAAEVKPDYLNGSTERTPQRRIRPACRS